VNADDGERREARVGQLDAEEGAQLLEEELLMPKVMQGNARRFAREGVDAMRSWVRTDRCR
jgi:hypothetical protein